MLENNPLPPEYDAFLAELADTSDHVRAMYHYALVLLMIDDEKVTQRGTRFEKGQEFLRVKTIVGDEFEIERPLMSRETDGLLLNHMRGIIPEEP